MNKVDLIAAQKAQAFCEKYNIPFEHLADILYEPKVVPMIRGKAFEFSVLNALERILPTATWNIRKQAMNAQRGLHDVDVEITHKSSGQIIRVECKLAKNNSYRLQAEQSYVSVKCMRSRTLGKEMVEALAPKLGIKKSVLAVHNDQYLPTDFDLVITSIGNAFYRTNRDTGLYEWQPTQDAQQFLARLGLGNRNAQDFAFNQMFVAGAQDLTITRENKIRCTRRKCLNPQNCGFIPNYPILRFDAESFVPLAPWVRLQEIESLLQNFL